MKVLIIRTAPNKVNTRTYNLQEIGLAKSLIRKGHICDVMYYSGREKDHIQEIEFDKGLRLKILWLHGYGFAREGIYPSLTKYAQNYDILQISEYTGVTSCWLNIRFPNKAVNFHGPYYFQQNKGDILKARVFDKTLLPLSNKRNMLVATKSVLATQYLREKGIKNVTTIGVGLDLDNLNQAELHAPKSEFVESIIKKKENSKYLLYIGVFEPRRNILFLLNVFKKINQLKQEYKLILVGNGKPEYLDLCKQEIKKLGLEDNVVWEKQLEQRFMPDLYKACDAFLLPTRYEIFGMVLLEAMYYGLPVFTTYNGGSSTLMNEDNGIIIKELNEKNWCDSIVSVLSEDVLLKRISENAHKTVAEKYTWDALADKFIEVYKQRLDRGSIK